MCQLLLKEGARVNEKSFNGLTALMRAADTGNLGIAVLLLFTLQTLVSAIKTRMTPFTGRDEGHTAIADVLADWPGVPGCATGRAPRLGRGEPQAGDCEPTHRLERAGDAA